MNEPDAMNHEVNEDLAGRFVAGGLPAEEAERFEEHYFACQECWREVVTANDIRQALVPRSATRGPRRSAWPMLAAAAVAAFAFVGVMQWRESQSREPVFRDASRSGLQTEARISGDLVELSWQAPPQADRYQVQIFRDDGELVATKAVTNPQASFPRTEIAGAARYRILALDELGGTIADSALQPLP